MKSIHCLISTFTKLKNYLRDQHTHRSAQRDFPTQWGNGAWKQVRVYIVVGPTITSPPVLSVSSFAHTRVPASVLSPCHSSPFHLLLPGTLLWAHSCLPLSLLVDSGANLIDKHVALEHNILLEPLAKPRPILYLNSKIIGRVTDQTQPITLIISGNHREQISLFLILSSTAPAVLGLPSLSHHNLASPSNTSTWRRFSPSNARID